VSTLVITSTYWSLSQRALNHSWRRSGNRASFIPCKYTRARSASSRVCLTDAQLLLQTLLPYLETLPPGTFLHNLGHLLPSGVPSPLLEMFHSHGPGVEHVHDHGAGSSHSHAPVDGSETATGLILNPHAAWFALASVAIKEWLYRLTAKVAAEEHSPVLKANALQ